MKQLVLVLTLLLTTIIPSCKKELYVNEKLDPILQQKNKEYQNGPKISVVDLSQFKGKVNQAALGNLKKQFNINNGLEKLMSLNLPEAFNGFAIETDSIKMIVANGHTSYVFPVKLNSPSAVTFQNLTIDEGQMGRMHLSRLIRQPKHGLMSGKKAIIRNLMG